MIRGVIYARYSCNKQREESIEGQIRECKEFARNNGIDVINTYIDRAMSATNDNRPEFQRMISDSYLDRCRPHLEIRPFLTQQKASNLLS